MLWRIRHPYQSFIEAPTKGDAFRAMAKRIAEDPESFITDIEDAKTPKRQSLIRRLFIGR